MHSEPFFDPFGESLTARNPGDLLGKLSRVSIDLPKRTEGRDSDSRERRCLVRYLRALAQHDVGLSFPLTIAKRESPDFLLRAGSRRIGLEVTDACTEKSQQAATQLERSPPGTVVMGEHHLVLPGGDPVGKGKVGDQTEREWAALVIDRIEEKTEDVPGYWQAEEYHLLINDETHLIGMEVGLGSIFLGERLSEESKLQFSLISVLRQGEWLLFDAAGRRFVVRATD